MSMRVGAVLGKDMSFQGSFFAVTSWRVLVGSAQHYLQWNAGNAHSSTNAIQLSVDSGGGATDIMTYPLGSDFSRYAFPDVATHDMDLRYWGRCMAASQAIPASGQLLFGLNGSFDALPFSNVQSAGLPVPQRLLQFTGVTLPPSLHMRTTVWSVPLVADFDDVLPILDPVNINPEWTSQYALRALRDQATGQDGYTGTFLFGQAREYTLPMRLVPDSVAVLFNHWWRTQAPLALTFDTSDAETTHLFRLISQQAPFPERVQPRQDLRTGVLQLWELGGGGLEF